MRICSPHCGLSPDSNLGGEVFERIILREMAALGAEFEIILAKNKPYEPVPGLHVTELPISRGVRWYVAPAVFPPAIGRVYKAKPFDILRAHSVRFVGPASLIARRLYKLPVPIITHHHHLDIDRLSNLVDKRVIQASDIVITGSHFSKRQLADELGVDVSHVIVIPYGIEDRFRPLDRDNEAGAELGLDGSPVVLFLGHIQARKNLSFLLECFAALAAKSKTKAKLVIGGQGALLPALKKQARELGIGDQVIFLGFVDEADKVKLYNLADVVAFPSLMEGFGFVVGEAMACGKPVVISDRGSLPELVDDGVHGFISSPTDVASFTSKLQALLENPELRLKMGSAARKRIEKEFRWPVAAKQMLEVYENVIS